MKYPNHPLSKAQYAQAEFEKCLPDGTLFNQDKNIALHQYGDTMTILSSEQFVAENILARAFVLTLGIANQFNIDLAGRLEEEVETLPSRRNFVSLANEFAKGTKVSRFGLIGIAKEPIDSHSDGILAWLGQRTARLNNRLGTSVLQNLAFIDGLPDTTPNYNLRSEFEGIVLYGAQDILTAAGLLNRKSIARMRSSKKPYDLMVETKGVWERLKKDTHAPFAG